MGDSLCALLDAFVRVALFFRARCLVLLCALLGAFVRVGCAHVGVAWCFHARCDRSRARCLVLSCALRVLACALRVLACALSMLVRDACARVRIACALAVSLLVLILELT